MATKRSILEKIEDFNNGKINYITLYSGITRDGRGTLFLSNKYPDTLMFKFEDGYRRPYHKEEYTAIVKVKMVYRNTGQ
jgi:hypothetical protein